MPLIHEEGEVLVHCSDCNGYLWSEAHAMLKYEDQKNSMDGVLLIPCPYRKLVAGKQECEPRTKGWQYGRS